MQGYVVQLREAIGRATPLLRAIGDDASRVAPAPGKWCPREVIGHLIDSASKTTNVSCEHNFRMIWFFLVTSRTRGYLCSDIGTRPGTS